MSTAAETIAVLGRRGSVALGAGALVVAAAVVHVRAGVRRRTTVRRMAGGAAPEPRGGDRLRAVLTAIPPPPRWAHRRLRRAGLSAPAAERTWRVLVGAAAAGVVAVALVAGPLPAALLAIGVGVVTMLVVVAVGDRASVLVDRELPAVLGSVAAGVRSGASLPVALREAAVRARGPAAEDLAVAAGSLAAGRGFVEVVEQWVRARPTAGVRMAGAALTLAAETGGAGAHTIDGVASTLRDRLAVERELAALSSQARASAVVVGVAPLGFVLLTGASDPEVWTFFLATPVGLACLAAGSVLDAIGAGWMIAVARGAR